MKKKTVGKRVASLALVFAMVLTLVGVLPYPRETAAAAENDTNKFIVHFNNEMNWETANIKYGSGSSWTPVTGFEDAKNNEFGVPVSEDLVNDGWDTYAVELPENVTEINGLFNNGSWGGMNQTGNFAITVSGDTEAWVTYNDAASNNNGVSVSYTAPEEWLNTLRVHFYNEKSWETVNAKCGAGSSWAQISGYEKYNNSEFGCSIDENEDNEGWYTFVVGLGSEITSVNGLFNNGSWGGENQTSNFAVNDISGDTEVWVAYNGTVSYEAADGWQGNLLLAVNENEDEEDDEDDEDGDEETESVIVMHFQNNAGWDSVYAYITSGTAWNAIDGYAYAGSWPGAEVEADPKNDGWYSFTITMKTDKFNCIFNNNSGNQTGNIELNPQSGDNEYWVYDLTGNTTTVAPDGWTASESNAPIDPNADSEVKSPVVNADRTVTVALDATGTYAGASDVRLMGTLSGTDWSTGLAMEKNEDGTLYVATTPVQSPGVYEYKFKIGGTWITDPLNGQTSSGNSKVVVAGLSDSVITAERGIVTSLPETLVAYDEDGNRNNEKVSYTLADESQTDIVVLEDGTITVAADSKVSSVELVASADGFSSKVTVNVVDKVYTYNVYYYDEVTAHMSPEAADLWAWEVGGANLGALSFTSLEELSDGREWLKATFTTSATNLGVIPRSIGTWSWQTANHYIYNTDKADTMDIYIVSGDDATYTQIPEVKESRERYVIVEYNRPEGDYEEWNIYSWNSGFGSSTEIYSEEVNGKQFMIVPVKDSEADFTLGFCMRRTTADSEWAEKDGGDHSVLVPADQSVVKVLFEQGNGIVSTLAYNKGYEMKGAADQISFYYRDDALLLSDSEDELEGKVSVVINGETYAMEYDAENERYVYDMDGCEPGEYAYYYLVDGNKQLDAFNADTVMYGQEECSVFIYKSFTNLGIAADVADDSMDYSKNNVLTVSFTGTDQDAISLEEIAAITADCSELGIGEMTVNPSLMKSTFSVKNNVKAGEKVIPVTMTDIYGNVYTTSATVTVTEADQAAFDWDEAVIYFAVTDRFFDGNTANNDGVDKDGSLSYHGGDFAGLQEKLDYLEDLGINTIWITPIVSNSDTTTTKDGVEIESTGYHGYWADDFTSLNPHLGTEEEFAALIEAVHAHGMKLMVDVVVNHAGYNTEDYFNTLLLDENGNYIPMIRDAGNTVSGDDVYSSLAGLPDFVTENEAVRDQLIAWQTDWVEKYGIDYFRVDTVKHVDTETWQAMKNALTEIDPEFKMIGEYSGAGYNSNQLGIGGMDSLLDFDFNDQAQAFVTGNLSSVESFLASRNAGIDNTSTVGAFLSSHDEDGLVYKLIHQNDLSEEEALNLFKVAASLQLTAKGQAVIYYGEELGQFGADNYPYQTNRYDFDWDEAEEQADDEGSMLNHYKTLLAIRAEYKELLARGSRTAVAVSDEAGYDVFARTYGNDTLYVGLNIAEEAAEVTFAVDAEAGSVIEDLYNGTEYMVADDQTVTVSIPAAADGGTVILAVTTGEETPDTDKETPDNKDPEDKDETDKDQEEDDKKPGDNEQEKNPIISVIEKVVEKVQEIIRNIFGESQQTPAGPSNDRGNGHNRRPGRGENNSHAAITVDVDEEEAEDIRQEDTASEPAVSGEADTAEIEIGEDDVPLAAEPAEKNGFPFVPVACTAAVVCIGAGVIFLFYKKKAN